MRLVLFFGWLVSDAAAFKCDGTVLALDLVSVTVGDGGSDDEASVWPVAITMTVLDPEVFLEGEPGQNLWLWFERVEE